jgi:hypothetical protein
MSFSRPEEQGAAEAISRLLAAQFGAGAPTANGTPRSSLSTGLYAVSISLMAAETFLHLFINCGTFSAVVRQPLSPYIPTLSR